MAICQIEKLICSGIVSYCGSSPFEIDVSYHRYRNRSDFVTMLPKIEG